MARDPDPGTQLEQLESELSSGGLAPGYVVRGAEAYFRSRALTRIRRAAREAEMEVCQHDAASPEFRPQSLQDDLCGSALFASSRCVLIEHPDALLKKAGSKESATARAVRGFLEQRRGTVVLDSEGLRADNATLKLIASSGGRVLTLRKLYDSPPPWQPDGDPRRTELAQWVQVRARELGLSLNPDQAVLLVAARGNDLAALDSQLELLRNGGPAELARFAETVGGDAAGSPFKVADALVGQRLKAALVGIETLYRGGMRKERDGTRERDTNALLAILMGSLRNRVRQHLAAASALEAGADPGQAAAQAGVAGRALQSFQRDLQRRSAREWSGMLADLMELERRSRSSLPVDQNDLVRFALRWGRPRRRRALGARN